MHVPKTSLSFSLSHCRGMYLPSGWQCLLKPLRPRPARGHLEIRGEDPCHLRFCLKRMRSTGRGNFYRLEQLARAPPVRGGVELRIVFFRSAVLAPSPILGIACNGGDGQAYSTPGNHIHEDRPEDRFEERGRMALGNEQEDEKRSSFYTFFTCLATAGGHRKREGRVAKNNHSLDFYIYTHI